MNRMFVVFVSALVLSSSIQAHHSTAMFDTTRPIRVTGLIAQVHFANPHSFIFIHVVDSDGQRVRWAVENSGTLAMTRQRGFDEETLRVGDPIEACGYAPKQAYSTREARVITGRLLILKSGPAEHWSHYGPLEACQALLASE